MITTEKTCFKCGAEKPLAEFYKHKQMADGHLNKCKTCTKSDANKKHRSENLERIRAYDRSRGSRKSLSDLRKYRSKNPAKYAAHRAITNGVKYGRIIRGESCETCGATGSIHGHHDDYSKQLEVRWLCAVCHHQWHAENGEAANG